MNINLSPDMICVVSHLFAYLDDEELEAVQFGTTNGHEAANLFLALEQEVSATK